MTYDDLRWQKDRKTKRRKDRKIEIGKEKNMKRQKDEKTEMFEG